MIPSCSGNFFTKLLINILKPSIASHLKGQDSSFQFCFQHYDDTPVQYTAIFHGCKNHIFHIKKIVIFFLFLLKT